MRRLLLACVLATGCLAGTTGGGSGNTRPAVMPLLSELPTDASKRDAILDQSGHTPGPEGRKGMSKRARKVETLAAVMAALIGQSYSTTKNVTIGVAGTVDENELFEKTRKRAPRPAAEGGEASAGAQQPPAAEPTDATTLVPWIQLGK